MHRSAHQVRAAEGLVTETIRILANPCLTKEEIMTALDRLTAVNALLVKVPAGIAEAEAAAATSAEAAADAALGDQLTALETNVAALPQPAVVEETAPEPVIDPTTGLPVA